MGQSHLQKVGIFFPSQLKATADQLEDQEYKSARAAQVC